MFKQALAVKPFPVRDRIEERKTVAVEQGKRERAHNLKLQVSIVVVVQVFQADSSLEWQSCCCTEK